MKKLLCTLIAAAFAVASLPALAGGANTAEGAPVAAVKKMDGAAADQAANADGATHPAATASANVTTTPRSVSKDVTVPKQTQGATFGEKVNAGFHAAGSSVTTQPVAAAPILAGAVPGGTVISVRANTTAGGGTGATATADQALAPAGAPTPTRTSTVESPTPSGSVIPSKVKQGPTLSGGAGGGAAAASYAATGRVVEVSATSTPVDSKPHGKQRRLKTKHDTAKNSVGNVR